MLIAGNWKLNCNIEEAKDLSSSILNILRDKDLSSDVALFPPNIYIDTVKKIVNNSNIFVGAQDCSIHISGAYTGDVSAQMLKDMKCKYIIVGHSERRIGKHETNNDEHVVPNSGGPREPSDLEHFQSYDCDSCA